MKLPKIYQVNSKGLHTKEAAWYIYQSGSMPTTVTYGASFFERNLYKDLGAYKIFERPVGRGSFWTF